MSDLQALGDEQAFQHRRRTPVPYKWIAAIIIVAAAAGGGWWFTQWSNTRWARAQAAQAAVLAEAGRNFEAYDLAVSAEPYLPADPVLAGIMPSISDALSVASEPPGARVYLKRFAPAAGGGVAEWTQNDSSDGYLATGGAWGDPAYAFPQFGGRPGFFASDKLGFRVARSAGAAGDPGGERIELTRAVPVFTPSSTAAFETFAAAYRYDTAAPLDASIEESVDTADWTRERITFTGAAGHRATAFLYRPRHVPGPLQVLHFVPGGDVDSGHRSLESSMDERMAPFVKSGRAAFGVVLEGYIGRIPPEGQTFPDLETVEYFERVARRVIDSQRGLDYLQTRTDIDRSRIGFLAPSAGARLGLILAAVETRYRAVVMIGSGLPAAYASPGIIPKANPVNFASHIRAPKLVVQGRYDEDSPLRTTAEPLFKLLAEPKQLYLYDGGHVPPIEVVMAATREWLDDKMGRVQR